MLNWIMILYYINIHGVTSQQISGLSEKGCKQQALEIMKSGVPVACLCVEKR